MVERFSWIKILYNKVEAWLVHLILVKFPLKYTSLFIY